MYKIELKLDGDFVNNFYSGSIYDLVFLDLEFWPHLIKGKAEQRIYGYTLTRILKASKQQYIKIKFLESEEEEQQLVKEIVEDINKLKNKIFIGFNIKSSDMNMLRKRLKLLNLYTEPLDINIFDLISQSASGYKGLSGLFTYLEIKVDKKIHGSYFRTHPRKVLAKKRGYAEMLINMFEYCLEDATAYFEIVSKWKNKLPLVTKEAIENELIYNKDSTIEPHAPTNLMLEVSPEFYTLLQNLSREIHVSESDVLRLGLALLKIVLEAEKSGQKIGIVDKDERRDL